MVLRLAGWPNSRHTNLVMPVRPGLWRVVFLALPAAAPIVLLCFSLTTAVFLLAEQFQPALVLAVGAVASAVVLRVVPLACEDAAIWPRVALLAGTSGWLVLNVDLYSQATVANRDPGVYSITAKWLLSHTTPFMLAPSDLPDGISAGSSGFQVIDGAVSAQGAHVLPGLAAIAGWVFRDDRALLAFNVVVGAVALLALYEFARMLVGPRWALLPVGALAVSLPMLSFSRALYTEPMTLVFVFSGLAWLWRAHNKTCGGSGYLLAGSFLGAGALARIDGVLPTLLILPLVGVVLGLSNGSSRKRTAIAAVAAAFVVLVGTFEVALNSPAYYNDLRPQRRVLLTLALAGAAGGLALGLSSAFWGSALRRHLFSRRFALGLSGAVAAVCVFMLSRPLWWVSRREPAYPLISGLQHREGLSVDPLRQYDEQTINWIVWYFGWPTVALGMIGLVLMTYRGVRRADTGLGAFILIVFGYLALYGNRASIVPDQVWAIRRLLPVVIPGLLIAAAFACREMSLRYRRGEPRMATGLAIVAAAALLFFPIRASMPLLGVQELVPQLDETKAHCAAVAGRTTVVAGALGLRLTPTVRAFCDVDAFYTSSTGHAAVVAARELSRRRGEPVVMLTADGGNFSELAGALPVTETVIHRWALRLSGRPSTVERTTRSVWGLVLDVNGATRVLGPPASPSTLVPH
jgi:hypothetical protein